MSSTNENINIRIDEINPVASQLPPPHVFDLDQPEPMEDPNSFRRWFFRLGIIVPSIISLVSTVKDLRSNTPCAYPLAEWNLWNSISGLLITAAFLIAETIRWHHGLGPERDITTLKTTSNLYVYFKGSQICAFFNIVFLFIWIGIGWVWSYASANDNNCDHDLLSSTRTSCIVSTCLFVFFTALGCYKGWSKAIQARRRRKRQMEQLSNQSESIQGLALNQNLLQH